MLKVKFGGSGGPHLPWTAINIHVGNPVMSRLHKKIFLPTVCIINLIRHGLARHTACLS